MRVLVPFSAAVAFKEWEYWFLCQWSLGYCQPLAMGDSPDEVFFVRCGATLSVLVGSSFHNPKKEWRSLWLDGGRNLEMASDGFINLVAFSWQDQLCKHSRWLGKIPLVWVNGDLAFNKTLQELSDMTCMVCSIVVMENIINYLGIASHPRKGSSHPVVVVLRDQRDSVSSLQELELPKGHNECGQV